MRIANSYTQKSFLILHFPIADIRVFFQVNHRTRKRRTAEYLGSRDWISVRSRELRESEDRQGGFRGPRAIASRRGRHSSGADRLARGSYCAQRGRDEGLWSLSQDSLDGRPVFFPAQNDGSGRQ